MSLPTHKHYGRLSDYTIYTDIFSRTLLQYILEYFMDKVNTVKHDNSESPGPWEHSSLYPTEFLLFSSQRKKKILLGTKP